MNITQSADGTRSTAHNGRSRLGIVIPTYNAAANWYALQSGLDEQRLSPSQIVVIDSSSTDATRSLAQKAGYRVICIRKGDFNHGATRTLACSYLREAEILVFMTQDAVLARPDSVERLCSSLDNPRIGAAYGRQLPRENADPIERHGRLFNYPPISEVRDFETRHKKGLRAAFFSNSFAVYRRSALEAVGSFPCDAIVSEEVTVAAKMLVAGWEVEYKADAQVIHSHHLSLSREFSRYFDIGVHHGREGWIIAAFGNASGDGMRYVRSEIRYLLNYAPLWIPYSGLRIASKYLAYNLGVRERCLPKALKRILSGNPLFWDSGTDLPGAAPARTVVVRSDADRSILQGPIVPPKGAAEGP